MKRFERREGRAAVSIAVAAVAAVLLLGGCATHERTAKMDALRNRHVSLDSATTSGPAVGRGGGSGGGSHGDWISAETRGLFDVTEIDAYVDQQATTVSPDATLSEAEIEGIPSVSDAAGAGDSAALDSENLSVPPEWQDPANRPRPGEEDLALAAAAELETVYFDFDAAEIRGDQMDIVRANAKWLQEHPTVAVNLGGHCDERGTEEYNMALSEKRATSVREALISMGIQPHRLSAVPYGEAQPADPQHSEDAWAMNRRVEFGPTALQLLSMDFSQ